MRVSVVSVVKVVCVWCEWGGSAGVRGPRNFLPPPSRRAQNWGARVVCAGSSQARTVPQHGNVEETHWGVDGLDVAQEIHSFGVLHRQERSRFATTRWCCRMLDLPQQLYRTYRWSRSCRGEEVYEYAVDFIPFVCSILIRTSSLCVNSFPNRKPAPDP